MALGNLSIHVSADIKGFTSSMDEAAAAAKSRMGQSSDAVGDFRASLLQASADMQRAALAMGGSMRAANDAIMASADKSSKAIEGVASTANKTDFSPLGEHIRDAIRWGVTTGVEQAQGAWEDFKQKSKVAAIAVGVVISAALAGTIAGTIYTAYKVVSATVGAISGMMDGSFYKSPNIDATIAWNDKLKELQTNLQLSSIEAGALADALNRLGVAPADYKAVYQGIAQAIHTNTDELDRLGIKYKDANGKFLEQSQILQNAKDVLDQYRAGWDRAQAAASVGMGTYEQITQVLKVNNDEVKNSADRLNEYGLGMSQYGQEALAKYQQTMREFDNENRLFSEGIKRVWSDAVLPAYTAIANVFKEGFPSLVQAFRVVVSAIVGLGYAMADGLYIAAKSVTTALGIINDSVNAVDKAVRALASGDLKGAGSAIVGVWDSAKERLKAAGRDMVDVIMENDKKIRLATGADDRDMPIDLAKDRVRAGRVWVPPPKDQPKGPMGPVDDPARKAFEGYLKQQDDFIAAEKAQLATREQFMQTYYQQEYMTARDFYGRKIALIQENLQTELDAYDREIKAAEEFRKTRDKEQDRVAVDNKIADIQRKKAAAIVEANKQIGQSQLELMGIQRQFDLATQEWSHQRDLQNVQAAQNIALMGRSTLEVQKLTEAYRIDAEVQERIYQLRKKDPNADVSGALAEAEKQKAIAMQMIQAAWDKQQSAAFGASEAIRKYGEEARNYGQQVESVLTNAFRGMEDAFANFVTTGKFGFKDLINSITADLARMSFKTVMSNLLDSFKGSGIGQSIMGAFGGAGTGAVGAASTTATNTALSTLGTTAATSTTALTTLTTSITAQDTAMATATASLGALATAADTAAAALASGSAGGSASGLGSLAGLAGSGAAEGAATDVGWEAMLAGAFAGGGDPPVGQVSLVGEKGPELFVPKTAGTIIPNDAFKSMSKDDSGQQQSNVFHFNFNVPQNFNRDSAKQLATQAGFATQRALRSIA